MVWQPVSGKTRTRTQIPRLLHLCFQLQDHPAGKIKLGVRTFSSSKHFTNTYPHIPHEREAKFIPILRRGEVIGRECVLLIAQNEAVSSLDGDQKVAGYQTSAQIGSYTSLVFIFYTFSIPGCARPCVFADSTVTVKANIATILSFTITPVQPGRSESVSLVEK